MAKEHEILVACEPCEENGILADATDPTVGIVCVQCGGKGCRTLKYRPFTGRKTRKGITRVRRSGQGFSAFSSEPSPDAGITYTDFVRGKAP